MKTFKEAVITRFMNIIHESPYELEESYRDLDGLASEEEEYELTHEKAANLLKKYDIQKLIENINKYYLSINSSYRLKPSDASDHVYIYMEAFAVTMFKIMDEIESAARRLIFTDSMIYRDYQKIDPDELINLIKQVGECK